MNEYTVDWSMQIEASSPEEAAKFALEILRDPSSIATVFNVIDSDGDLTTVDTLADDQTTIDQLEV